MDGHHIQIGSELLVVRHLASGDEARACARIMASSEPWLTLGRGYEVVGELRDYIVRGHSEWLLRKSVAPLADWTTQRGQLAFEPRRVSNE
jgi:hypothetical protein